MRDHYRRWLWKNMKSRWPLLTEKEMRTVIRSAAARERNKPRHTRVRHRNTRLAAVAYYRQRFGDAEFLKEYSSPKMPPVKNMWLPGGYAWWKVRGEQSKVEL